MPDFLPFYLEVLGGVFNGDNETAFGYGRLDRAAGHGPRAGVLRADRHDGDFK